MRPSDGPIELKEGCSYLHGSILSVLTLSARGDYSIRRLKIYINRAS